MTYKCSTLNRIIMQRSVKIEILSFVMALIIVWRHAALPVMSDIPNCLVFGYIGSQMVFSALSMFMFTAGFLFFRSFCPEKYSEKVRTRFHSLFIPYLIWNIVSTIIIYCLIKALGPQCLPDSYSFNSIGQVLSNILLARYTILWFLGDLFIFALASPLLYYLLKDKRIGIAVLIIFTAITACLHHPHFSPLN